MATAQEDLQLLLEILLEDKNNRQIQEELKQLIQDPKNDIQKSIDEMIKTNIELEMEIKKLETGLQQPSLFYLIQKNIPEKKMKFTSAESPKDNSQYSNISCSFQVTTQLEYELQQGQALITFEDEQVAQNVIKTGEHLVELGNEKVKLIAKAVPLKTGVSLQVHTKISKKKIDVAEIPDMLSEEQMKDKLALSFSKSQYGGGEVEHVEYNKNSRTAVITFLENGVADNVLKRKEYPLFTSTNCCHVNVSPHMEKHVEKLQVFSGISKRTVLLIGLNIQGDEESIEDEIHIHFQKESNGGGDVDIVKCALKEPQIAYFEADLNQGSLIWGP
ncbi:N-myc-interactor [Trichosurus vulpecula]|uniref:N-myc-interactor n=1 Tax=Trichosurus vulpecula TaxID=9337 RepID=UPI00186AD66C|nr:N-myc-interactor [Trichosurus vulpecula]XP_036600836.1 N-myc-interactor [Trichosurus vulpecula]